MTTVQLPVEEIAADAREVRFSRVIITLVLGLFWVIGWVAGHLWVGAVMCALAVRRGWRDGTGWAPPQPRPQPSRL